MMTRQQLQALLKPVDTYDELETRLRAAVAECYELHDNLTATQTRCTELLEEARVLRANDAWHRRALREKLGMTVLAQQPHPRLRAVFIAGSAIGGGAIGQGTGIVGAVIGALAGAVIGFAATGDRSP